MITVTSMKCACEPCLCVVSTNEAVQKDGKYYCSQACASGGEVRPKGGRKSVVIAKRASVPARRHSPAKLEAQAQALPA